MIADREVDLAAARLLILDAAFTKAAGRPFAAKASMAKLFASEAAARCTDAAVQIFGGAGYMRERSGSNGSRAMPGSRASTRAPPRCSAS